MIEIRALTEREIGFAAATERALFSDPWGERAMEEVLSSSCQKALVLFSDSVPAGYLIHSEAFDEAEILRIGTAEGFQKQGFATALLEHLFSDLKSRGFRNVFLEVRSRNLPAKSLYEKMGFEAIASRRNYYQSPSDDALIYQKKL